MLLHVIICYALASGEGSRHGAPGQRKVQVLLNPVSTWTLPGARVKVNQYVYMCRCV
jgi:hypothetical protein